jgi:DNA modification methylase
VANPSQLDSRPQGILDVASDTIPLYRTQFGQAFVGDALELLRTMPDSTVDLVLTSPPFALRRKKSYGNVEESEYVEWLKPFGGEIFRVLKDSGSFVLDLGGSYRPGVPSRSLYNFRVLLSLCDNVGFHLAQDFYWFNPARLPSPIEWVNKRKIRAKDSVNTIWWLSKSEWPKSDVRNVLQPYSERMKKLISNPEGFYKPKKRPSGHDISASFGKDNGGAIPSNMISAPNTDSNSAYLRFCKEFELETHPARFPEDIPRFFIRMLTDPNDLVLDVFAGSNTTGTVAESLERKWLAFESKHEYLITSAFRFLEDTKSVTVSRLIRELADRNANIFLSSTCTLLTASA